MKFLFPFICILALISCEENDGENNSEKIVVKYYTIKHRSSKAKESYWIQYPIIENDSAIIIPSLWIEEKDKKVDDTPFRFSLPKDAERPIIHKNGYGIWLDQKRIVELNGTQYEIYKYKDKSSSADGSSNWFYVPEIGIIILYSVSWGNYEIMVEHPHFPSEIIYYLGNWILKDDDFLRSH